MPNPGDGMTKQQIVKLYDRKMAQRARIAEDRIKALEEAHEHAMKELRHALTRLAAAERKNDVQDNAPVYQRPHDCVPYADGPRYKGGFGVPSDSTPGKVYIVSFDTAVNYWVCSCPAGINRGTCKHLTRYDRPGRLKGKQATPQFVAPSAQAQPLPPLPVSMRKPVRQFARDQEV